MKARLLLGLCALLAFPGCFDPIVGSQCAKGYSRCGSKCVVTGTCTLADAGDDAFETGVFDGSSDETELSDADSLAPDTSTDGLPSDDASDAGTGSPADGLTMGDDAGLPDADGGTPNLDGESVEDTSGMPEEDAPLGGNDDAMIPKGAEDAPVASPDTLSDASSNLDLIRNADVSDQDSDDDGPSCPDCDGGVDAPILEAGSLAVDGLDAGDEDAGLGTDDAEGGDAQASDALGVEAGPLVCDPGFTNCNEQCVDQLNDRENCGGCANICTSDVCSNGVCLVCASDEKACSGACVNIASNPDNCGDCDNRCASGLCSNKTCEAAGTGRVIVIGHDYSFSRPTKNRILGNAVFLWPVNPVQLLLYASDATAAGISGADGAIAQVGTATGRTVNKMYTTRDAVPGLLPSVDVFLIYNQSNASDSTLTQLGTDWAEALSTFVNRGGTVIVLDADQPGNAGTVQILYSARLLNLTRQASASGPNVTCNVVARGDALATGLSRSYWCQDYSTTFTLNESSTTITSVVESTLGDASSAPVVISKIF